jgi:hypothetical protein
MTQLLTDRVVDPVNFTLWSIFALVQWTPVARA